MMMMAVAPRQHKGFRLFGVPILETEKKPIVKPLLRDQMYRGGIHETQMDDLSLRLGLSPHLSLSLGFHIPAKPLKEEKMTDLVLFSDNHARTDLGIVKPQSLEKKEPTDETLDEFGNCKRDIPDSLLPIKKRRFWSGTVTGSHGMIKVCSLQGNVANRVKVEESANLGKGKKRRTVGSDSNLPLMKRRQLYVSIGNRVPVAVVAEVVLLPPVDLKNMVISMGGIENSMRLVIEKKLTATDVNSNGGRMSMPRKQTSLHLDQSEWNVIEGRDSKGKPNKINVVVVDPKLEKHVLAFKKWYYDDIQWSYVLCGGWNHLRNANTLTEGVTVGVWSFRMEEDRKLAFAISKIGHESPAQC